MHAPAPPKAKAKAKPEFSDYAPSLEWWLLWHVLVYLPFVYRDSRFKNTLGGPQPSQRDKTGKPRGYIPPTDPLKFDPWARPWDKPAFDRCMFVPAAWAGALCGGDVSARVARKIGTGKSYEELLAAAETTPAQLRAMFIVRGKYNKSLFFRWKPARITYDDIRRVGKIRCDPDFTYMQAAARELEWDICCALDRTPHSLRIRGPVANLENFTAGKVLPLPDSGPPPQHVLRELPSVKEIKEAARQIDQGCDDTELALSMALRCVMRERWPQAPLTLRARNRLYYRSPVGRPGCCPQA
jgi:hypothetical protein